MTCRPNGMVARSTWHSLVLEESHHYLKGSSAPKGGSKANKGKGKGGKKGKGKKGKST